MSRFTEHRPTSHILLKVSSMILLFSGIIVLFLFSSQKIREQTLKLQYDNLQNALHRDILYCYAAEGAYPPDLEYLKEHYGLTYDESSFFVDYRLAAANVYPDITILELED